MDYWTPQERRFLRGLSTPDKIQEAVDRLIYNPTDHASSVRWVMITGEGHCFEGGLLAAAALEFHGHKPLMVDLIAENDDHHVITVYRTSTGWGSLSKTNTTLLGSRRPFYRDIRELVMSYFDFYFNTKGQLALYGYSNPINLNLYNSWNWRTSDDDLMEMGMDFSERIHYEIVDPKKIVKLKPVSKRLNDACFLGADPNGLYKA
jgi:hypothetical protein